MLLPDTVIEMGIEPYGCPGTTVNGVAVAAGGSTAPGPAPDERLPVSTVIRDHQRNLGWLICHNSGDLKRGLRAARDADHKRRGPRSERATTNSSVLDRTDADLMEPRREALQISPALIVTWRTPFRSGQSG